MSSKLSVALSLITWASLTLGSPVQQPEVTWITDDLTKVRFTLYTRNTGDGNFRVPVETIDVDLANLGETDFDPLRPKTVLIMHGFRSDETFAEKFTTGTESS